jgi:hypothetical protein
MPDSRRYSAPLILKRRCDRTLHVCAAGDGGALAISAAELMAAVHEWQLPFALLLLSGSADAAALVATQVNADAEVILNFLRNNVCIVSGSPYKLCRAACVRTVCASCAAAQDAWGYNVAHMAARSGNAAVLRALPLPPAVLLQVPAEQHGTNHRASWATMHPVGAVILLRDLIGLRETPPGLIGLNPPPPLIIIS